MTPRTPASVMRRVVLAVVALTGKSSLLDLLAGRKTCGFGRGRVLWNGAPPPRPATAARAARQVIE